MTVLHANQNSLFTYVRNLHCTHLIEQECIPSIFVQNLTQIDPIYQLEGVNTLQYVKKVAFHKIFEKVWRKLVKSGLFKRNKIADFPDERQFLCS